jgi:L-2-hydroxyglutarate oxidase LhgO
VAATIIVITPISSVLIGGGVIGDGRARALVQLHPTKTFSFFERVPYHGANL